MYLFYRTLKDIGFKRVFLRIKYEIRKIIEKKLTIKNRFNFFNMYDRDTVWNSELEIFYLKYRKIKYDKKFKNKKISFNFLSEKRSFLFPFKWNNFGSSRLWQFNLHYFNWSREWLDYLIKKNKWPSEANHLEHLIDDWIDNNQIGIGDGWNSYTLSIRIRNWIYLFRLCPDLISDKRINSLWKQICWLHTHQEDYYGGNHLLENLITLVIAGLQFYGARSSYIHNEALRKLEFELRVQILKDGGHFERSASYHFLILDRLTELAFIKRKISGNIPNWLTESIKKMLIWGRKVILHNNLLPRFNDSSADICYNPSIILKFAESLLINTKFSEAGLRQLISLTNSTDKPEEINFESNKTLIDLKDTGWTILRPEKSIEILFKCGVPCPNYLPAHAHSDQLSFDIFIKGKPIIASTGTSIYQKSFERSFERSGAAHNVFQLGVIKNLPRRKIIWVEPVEVWNEFRVARKAKPLSRNSGVDKDGSIWVEGEHDGFNKYGASHKRSIKFYKSKNGEICFYLKDKVFVKKLMAWRVWFHLGPNQNKNLINPIILELKKFHKFEFQWKETWYSSKFGQRITRKSLCIHGQINKGFHEFSFKIPLMK